MTLIHCMFIADPLEWTVFLSRSSKKITHSQSYLNFDSIKISW